MIKGCEKRMIFIKNTGSDIFEEAYFVLRNDIPTNNNQEEIVRTATAIINENNFSKNKIQKTPRLKTILPFFLGCSIGVILCAILFIFTM